jgi:thymidylate kinase
MDHVVVEGLPAVGKSEVLALLERFHPDSVRVLPELVKEIVERDGLDLYRDREALTTAILEALPERRARILEILDRGFLCLEESHLGVHRAYSLALGDTGFVEAYERLRDALPTPDAFLRLEIPVQRSLQRQRARGTPGYEVDAAVLERTLSELDRWHAARATRLIRVDADRPAHEMVSDLAEALGLSYGAPRESLRDTFDVLLLLGRPASGKSEFIDFMEGLSAAERAEAFRIAPFRVVDDFPILWERFEEDDVWERLGRPRLHSKRCDGNYAVTDDGLWPFLIEKINRRVEPVLTEPGRLDHRTLIVEFSRGGPTGYADALTRLSPAILEHAAILYVSVSFEESWRRNIARYDEKLRGGVLTHSVPREEMERTYGTDDWSSIAGAPRGTVEIRGIRVPYATMNNEPESTDPIVLSGRYAGALGPLYDAWRGARPWGSTSSKTRTKFR